MRKAVPDPKIKILERDIQKVILDWLACIGVFAWRQNRGAMGGEYKGKRRFVRFGPPGQSDILGLIPPHGRFLAIEVKRVGEDPTDDQQRFLDRVTAAGGLAFAAHSLEECQRYLLGAGVTEMRVSYRRPS